MIDISRWIHQFFIKNALAVFVVMVMFGSGLFPEYAAAQDVEEKAYSVGLRVGNLFEVDDAPVNSMPMVVCYVRRKLNPSWSAVLSLDSFAFDVKGASDFLGEHNVKDQEFLGKMSLITASMEYVLCQKIKSLPIQPYVQAGVGIGFVDFDEDDSDSVAGDGQADIEIDADGEVEVVPTISLGVRYPFMSWWYFDAGTRFDYHITQWTIKDRHSGREVHINHFSALGAYAGFGVDF